MARVATQGIRLCESQLEKLGRTGIRQIVEKGSLAAQEAMRSQTRMAGHVRTGALMASVLPGKLYEGRNAAIQFVDFEGDHGEGITNHDLAYILDNGGKHGDRFLTGNERETERAVREAMEKESERILGELDK